MERDDLFETYNQTSYRVFPNGEGQGGELLLRVGQRHPELDLEISRLALPRRSWVFITAWNPHSQPLEASVNEARNAELVRVLDARGLAHWSARAASDDGSCSEDSFLVPGVTPDEAQALGRSFGQLAVVVGEVGQPARLLACDG